MNNLWYLAIVVGLSAVGVFFVWLRGRPSSSPRSSIDQFNDKMKALSPEMAIRPDQTADRVSRDPRTRRNERTETS